MQGARLNVMSVLQDQVYIGLFDESLTRMSDMQWYIFPVPKERTESGDSLFGADHAVVLRLLL
jgi:hypothetical protein